MVSACCAPPPTMSANATTVGVRNGTKVYALSTTETLKPQGKFVPRWRLTLFVSAMSQFFYRQPYPSVPVSRCPATGQSLAAIVDLD